MYRTLRVNHNGELAFDPRSPCDIGHNRSKPMDKTAGSKASRKIKGCESDGMSQEKSAKTPMSHAN